MRSAPRCRRMSWSMWFCRAVSGFQVGGYASVINASALRANPAGMSSHRPGQSAGSVPRYWQSWR